MKDQAGVLDTLVRARELYAAAPSHAPVDTFPAPGTVCAATALEDAGSRSAYRYRPVAHALAMAMGADRGIARWNAEHTTEEVLAAFDRAIATEGERCRTRNGLDGPSVPVRVEPVKLPNVQPVPLPATEPVRTPEKVPA